MKRAVAGHPRFVNRRLLLAAAVSACFAVEAQALPSNPAVVNGVASFAQAGNVLTVTNSNGTIINWQTFGIAAGETTRFLQPSSSSAVLNHVLSNNPSALYGTLTSNGKVWLVNPAGILVGAGAVIDTAGFVGSTLTVRAEDFLAGRLTFQATPGAGNVVNQGTITTPAGGSVYLVGSNVANEGVITTPGGETILAAGQTVSLIDTATPGVKVEITGAANNVTNLGNIVAEAGRIGIAGVIVRNSGTLDASSVVNEGGRIFLKASQDTYVDGAGRIAATGTKGGQVEVLGNRVAVADQAEIDVSGAYGGGKVMVGGDFQGKNPNIQNAQITYFGPEATIRANATNAGDGGTAIVWADDTTRAYGTVVARGGASGGNGGFVETSGHRFLDVNGVRVDTKAPNGSPGTWLLDPDSITVVASGSDNGGSWSGGVFGSGGSDATISWTTVESNLASGNVKLQTGTTGTGDITFSPGTYTSTNRNTLSLWAYGGGGSTGNINFNSAFLTLAGSLEVVGGWNGTANSYTTVAGHGDVTMSNSQIVADSSISVYGGNLSLTNVRSNQQNVTLTATGDVQLLSSFTGYFDDYSFVYNLPFALTFFGTRYTQAYITTNGLIVFPTNGTFVAGGGTYRYSDSVAGLSTLTDDQQSGVPLAVIAPAWNDWILRASTGKDVLIKQLNNSTLAVQWNVSKFADESHTANFEALLNRNGNIQFNYGSANTSYAGDVTIGLSNGSTVTLVSQLMNLPNFSLNLLPSTTFAPAPGGSYTETVSSTATPLANMTGAVSGGRLLESSFGSSGASGISALLGTVNINAGGLINGYTGVEAMQLNTVSNGGLILAASVGSFSASNTGSGDVVLSNDQPLTLGGISNNAGNISVSNIGAVTVGGNISASGAVTLAAQSPLTISSGATITAGGDINLTASGSTPTDQLTVNGGASSTGGNIGLTGGGGVTIGGTASLSAPLGSIQAVSDFGSVLIDPLATINTPNFLVNGVATSTQSSTSNTSVNSNVTNTIVTATQTSPETQQTQEAQLSTLLVPPTESSLFLLEQSNSQTIGGGTDEFGSREVSGKPAGGKKPVAQCKG